jgi:hypothetical protein
VSFTGNLIAESLRTGALLEGIGFTVPRIWRVDAGDPSVEQPVGWTFIELEVASEHGEALAQALRDALDPDGGWYCDFHSDDETYVVFAGRIFRYPRRDPSGRAEAEAYARSVGVPESQIDWPE